MTAQRIQRQQAVENLHTRHAAAVHLKCVRMLGDAAEAEDAVQETFIRAYRSYDSFSDRAPEAHLYWLYRTAHFVCLHLLRTKRRRRIAAAPRWVQEAAAVAPMQEQQVDARRTLDRVLEHMDQRDKSIVAAHFVRGMNQGEVASVMGVSRRAVVKRLTSLRRRAAPSLPNAVGS